MKQAERESFYIVKETCPAIDAAFDVVRNDLQYSLDQLIFKVKEQTVKLRESLTETVKRAIEAEEQIKELEKEKSDLEDRVEELEMELKSLLDSTS